MKILMSLGILLGYALTVLGFWRSEADEKRSFWWSLGMLVGVIVLLLSVLLFCVPNFFKG